MRGGKEPTAADSKRSKTYLQHAPPSLECVPQAGLPLPCLPAARLPLLLPRRTLQQPIYARRLSRGSRALWGAPCCCCRLQRGRVCCVDAAASCGRRDGSCSIFILVLIAAGAGIQVVPCVATCRRRPRCRSRTRRCRSRPPRLALRRRCWAVPRLGVGLRAARASNLCCRLARCQPWLVCQRRCRCPSPRPLLLVPSSGRALPPLPPRPVKLHAAPAPLLPPLLRLLPSQLGLLCLPRRVGSNLQWAERWMGWLGPVGA